MEKAKNYQMPAVVILPVRTRSCLCTSESLIGSTEDYDYEVNIGGSTEDMEEK